MKEIHSWYLTNNGVKRSFNRFIFEVLTEEARRDLFFNIHVNQIDPSDHRVLKEIDDQQKKADFLFWIRNAYTHSAMNSGSPAGGVFKDFYEPVVIDGKPMKGYVSIALRTIRNKHYDISTRDWPFALIRAVNAGMAT
ncbi:MAG: hypothetical protein IPN91_07330 [Holophagaceae bacterium]|uniref:Uncharacterized protein n=1 Tax=Candidatus Geothrix odensensis TaxID=2954440 RepID=A0A936F1K4_9BACT|nr:hypothetical protein [Candidatus Geothrix odensensis]